MAFNKEFIIDSVKTIDNYFGWPNAVAFVQARWKITHTDYPEGAAYHVFVQELDVESITESTFVLIDDVTDQLIEQWVTSKLDPETVIRIEMNALEVIKASHYHSALTTHYQNPDMLHPPLI